MVNNKVIMIGRLTKDAQLVTPKEEGQKKIARFNIAVSKMLPKSATAAKEEANAYFFRCTAFERQADFLEIYGKKGMKFALEGHLTSGSYTNKDGVTIPTVEIIAENIQFCEKKVEADEVHTG